MQLPEALLESLTDVKGFNKNSFEQVHASGEKVTSVRMNPDKLSIANCQLSIDNKVPWTQFGFYLKERPSFTFDPLFHAGCYYVQEASSMFLEQAMKQTVDLSKPLKVLDLCAAPGGKSTHLLSLLSKESLLVSNEVIRSRANILTDNIIKWGNSNVLVTNNDPRDFHLLENYFDVIVVDAPCSGSGLFRRDPDAMDEWSLNNVALCSQRQQRILADVLPALKKEGVLIYSTCSYSKDEDEEIVNWLTKELPVANCQLSIESDWGITSSDGGYRFWPDQIKGEGFFIVCFRKTEGEDSFQYFKKQKTEKFSTADLNVLDKYLFKDGLSFLKVGKIVHAVPENIFDEMNFLASKLRIVNMGLRIGEIIRDKLVPDHALALSGVVADNINRISLNYEQAILYLKKKEIKIEEKQKGWSLVTFNEHPLGWVNVLPSRVNNYYPKELRILKD